jgi:CubicO group peptidase (beta-lactamase class C family)
MNKDTLKEHRRYWWQAFCCIVLVFIANLVQAQESSNPDVTKHLDGVVQAYVDTSGFMGSVLVAQKGHILLDKGYGSANLEWNIPNDPSVKFRLGSLTKQLTAALILQLQDKGRLRIEDPVKQYLPNIPETWNKITVAELLGNTSGIANFISLEEYRMWSMVPHTVEEDLAFFEDKPLDFAPGTQFEYSNSNYIVLGAIIEKLTGKSYGDCLRESIFEPLGMKDSGLDRDNLLLPRRAEGYLPTINGYAPARVESMSVAWATGGIYSTTGDLLKWEQGLFGGKVVSPAALQAMTARRKNENWAYGLGLMIHDQDGFTVVDHGGSIEGFNTHLGYVPQFGITVVVLSNVDAFVADQMAEQLLNVALDKPATLPMIPKAVAITKEELERFVGVYALPPLVGPNFTLTINLSGNLLTAKLTGREPTSLVYEGVKNGHSWFFSPKELVEIEFIPDNGAVVKSIVYHLSGEEFPGNRK